MRILEGPKTPLASRGWQEYCTSILRECVALPEAKRASEWADARKQLIQLAKGVINNPSEQRIVIADAHLENKNLKGFDFRFCYFARTHFNGSTIRNCSFQYAIFRNCWFNDADVSGANFELAAISGTDLTKLKYNRHTNFNFIDWEPGRLMSPQLQGRIERDRLIAASRSAPFLIRFLNILTGYGFGIGRVSLLCGLIVIAFAAIYWQIDSNHFAVGAGSSQPSTLPFWNYLMLSFERFF